ncbi:MAG: hypothetical protein M3238_06830 [Actinomycetota bacterium]|nr:hypothetical protein [Actinomycetota bacterium]
MITAIVIGVLACAALVYVAMPLRRGPVWETDDIPSPLQEAEEKKSAALAGIVDLEQERDAGKLSAEDFHALRAEYESDALEALKELDATPAAAPEDDLEKEIAAARQRMTCPSCGAPRDPGSACSRCGA